MTTSAQVPEKQEIVTPLKLKDDCWIPSSCQLCYNTCSILAHRVDGVVIKVEGNPKSVVGKGRLCGKGVSGLMTHYDPHRLTKPLRRTTKEKGIGIDPGWKEISWDEALDEIVGVLKKVREDDPRKLVVQRTTTISSTRVTFATFASGFGTPNISTSGGGLHCGNAAHLVSGMMHASWSIVPDFDLCNYAIYFGASKGHSAGHAANSNMKLAADARVRGMRTVVVDPMCNFAAAKASEWVPIRVGTDAALALSMCNVIANELGTLDIRYLKSKTNGPYLVGPDKKYIRDTESGNPLVWDSVRGRAVPFDKVSTVDMALDGDYLVEGVPCRPSFALLRDHLKKFTPELAAEITTVAATDIRRLAHEFATEARIDSTISIQGESFPYRPVAAIAFRGSQGHLNSVYNFLAVDLLNHLVGCADMPGGCLGFNPACDGFPGTGRLKYRPKPGKDGLMVTGMWMGFHNPYPLGEPRRPSLLGLQDLFVVGMTSPFLHSKDREMFWEAFELPYRPEVLINYGANLVMSMGTSETVAESLKKFKFIVSFDLFLNETSDFADIILPDCSYLQSLDSRASFPFIFAHPAGMGEWCWSIKQPSLDPIGEQRPFADVLIEIAERVGFRPDMNAAVNSFLGLQPPYRLLPSQHYSWAEICDRELRNNFGDEHGLEWFKENGVMSWKKNPHEVYWRATTEARVPIYWEFFVDTFEKIQSITSSSIDLPKKFYEPLVDFIPCRSLNCTHDGFDFFAFYYRDTLHTNSFTMENPWLDEAAMLDPYSYRITIHREKGESLGLRDGQLVRVETESGRSVEGRVRLSEAIHIEGLGIAALAGHWADGMPIAKGKGIFFNELLELDWEHVNPVNLNLDLCARVKVTKLGDVL